MAVIRSAMLRGGATLGIVMLGLSLASAAYLWWGTTSAVLLGLTGITTSTVALARLYNTGGPARFGGMLLTIGLLATIALYIVGVLAVRDITLSLVGIDVEAVVERTWTTESRGSTARHCTLRRPDGTPIPRELATSCRGRQPGDTIRVVLDPQGRLPPIGGPKKDLPVVGETLTTATAGLVALATTTIGSAPASARRTTPAVADGDVQRRFGR